MNSMLDDVNPPKLHFLQSDIKEYPSFKDTHAKVYGGYYHTVYNLLPNRQGDREGEREKENGKMLTKW